MDIDPTLWRIVGWPKVRNPWTEDVTPTITGSCAMLARYWAPDEDGKRSVVVRLLSGLELFRLAGWGPDMWHPKTPESLMQDKELLTSLAGNAFSGFAVGPMLAIGCAMLGAVPHMFTPPEEQPVDANDGAERSSDEDSVAS